MNQELAGRHAAPGPTRSFETNPGTASPQSAQVLTGIWNFNKRAGLGTRPAPQFRPLASWLPMIVAALIRISSAALSSLNANSPSRRSKGTSTGNTCTSHLPAGVLNTAQHAPTTFVFHHE
ncbi:hypothetical protein RI444_08945 [Paenarthrobacter sp. AT5]|uniref:hypothetical protein n=1 Tax=Paenarthrobacter TaxID=1742992 RepID=UPI001A98C20C|nr:MULTISPECIES: hypothetical protein [Paenarthrobacter]WOC62719.1 hypothetical protein RI444_08945 [Paenarthrobacter sp. AT5]